MGLVFADVRHLIEWRKANKGGRAVTLGRMNLYLHPKELKQLAYLVDAEIRSQLLSFRWGQPADDLFLRILRFDQVDAIDFSDYEGASIVHDIGTPLPAALRAQFDLAVDGGTLEHIFNFPIGLANLIHLVRIGGTVYMNGPANNLSGHGFYQFSPELLYRIFSKSNGFDLSFVRLIQGRNISVEQTSFNPVFNVIDPLVAGSRVNLCTCGPVNIAVLAKKMEEVPLLSQPVLQSDYQRAWQRDEVPPSRLKVYMAGRTPGRLLSFMLMIRGRYKASLWNRRHFRRVRWPT